MSQIEWIYTISWIAFSVVVLAYALCRQPELSIAQERYRIFLGQKWKLATATIGTIGITAMGPFTHDPTRDFVTAPMMAITTFFTAPWVVGIIYRVLVGRRPDFTWSSLVVYGCSRRAGCMTFIWF